MKRPWLAPVAVATVSDTKGVAVAKAGVGFWQELMSCGFQNPAPEAAGDSYQPGGQKVVTRAEAATTCLLLTIQRLLRMAMDRDLIKIFDDTFDPSGEAYWIIQPSGEGQWVEAPKMRDALVALHLEAS